MKLVLANPVAHIKMLSLTFTVTTLPQMQQVTAYHQLKLHTSALMAFAYHC